MTADTQAPAPTGDMVDISAFAYAAIGFLLDRLNEFEREIDDDQIGREYAGHVAPAVARLRQALTAAPSPSASTMRVKELEWEPIASAPKDGTVLLLFADAWEYTHGSVQTGYFQAGQWYVGDMVLDENGSDFDPLAECDDEDDEDAFLAESEENVGPTHWMHLPGGPGETRRVQSCQSSAGGEGTVEVPSLKCSACGELPIAGALCNRADCPALSLSPPKAETETSLADAARTVLETFEKDEAQGFRSKDRQFAISVLKAGFELQAKAETETASERERLVEENRRLREENARLSKAEYFWDYDDPETGYHVWSDALEPAPIGEVVHLLCGATLPDIWVTTRVLTVDDQGDADETEPASFDNEADARACYETSLAAARAALAQEPAR